MPENIRRLYRRSGLTPPKKKKPGQRHTKTQRAHRMAVALMRDKGMSRDRAWGITVKTLGRRAQA